MTGPRCGNDSCRGGIKRFLPFASGQVLPLPSSASRGIGGCHLPPLGEGRTVADSPDVAACLWCCCAARRGRRALQKSVADSSGFCGRPRRPHPFPPPAGEGVAHKGDRRGRTWRDRDVEMTATVGVCERFYRLQAVRFSLFRHPSRGGSADATFPRWGKEGRLRIRWTLRLVFGAAARRAGVGAPYRERRCEFARIGAPYMG